MRLGLIGLGRIGSLHAESLLGLDRVDELLVTDALPGVADAATESLRAKFGASGTTITAVSCAADMFTSGIDGVVIASPTGTHLELLSTAVAARVPTFCEKPVAADPAAAVHLVRLADDAGVPVQVGFPRRFDPAFRSAKHDLDSGALGRLTTVRSTTLDPAPPPAGYLAGSGGIFRDCSIHDLDAIRWVTGRDVLEVYATGSDAGDASFREAGDLDTASILLTLDDGSLGVVSNTRYNGRGYDVRLELHGSRDAVAAGLDDFLPLRSADPATTFPAGPPHHFFMSRFAVAFRAELAAFTDVVAGAPSPCTLADGVEASWLAEACALSHREHRPVSVSEVREFV